MKRHPLVAALAAAAVLTVASASAAQPDPNRVLVRFKPGAGPQAENAVRGAGGRVHLKLDRQRVIAVSVPAQALAGLRNNPNIEYVEPDAPRYALGQVTPYGINNVQAPQAWSVGAEGQGVKVCVIDSGINAAHEDFAGVAMTGYPSGWNNDSCGHGTHVAGTIAAVNNTAGVVGVSPGKVSLHIVKVFDGASCGWSYASTLVDAANRCEAAGAKVINMSLGGSTSSTTEKNAFADLNAKGVLSIAAAGNDGNNRHSYPASYDSVVSVAAVDQNNVKADFSQYTSQVEIAAPGVGVLSTYPLRDASLEVGAANYIVSAMTGTVQKTATGGLVDGGRCTAPGGWAGKVVLCERGDISFVDKVNAVTSGGGVAAIVYNNAPGGFSGTLGDGVTSTIPALSLSQEDGRALVAGALGQSANASTVAESNTSGYAYLDGTSMATPHVAGAAAVVWSANPSATNDQVRTALTGTALDLGAAGRDTSYGYGLVRTFAAAEAIVGGGGGEPATAPTGLTAQNFSTRKGRLENRLAWSGGDVAVDVFRNGGKVASSINNTGAYTDSLRVRGSGSVTYKVCNAGTASCSNQVSVSY
ncbi:S8 family serine peptidase [Cognatilysobacter bugurensis]|uniref:Peptidase S8 n=1 Tax=Cognatilysobacter bugurensis TaxID=543356 RepID=A0A918T0R3_9GAMM|nr:S8 family serine peptidase [Lysobacter bugurensis]GHA82808.1 peptidase S8 [Lysobacter bugurensis]